MSVPTSAPPVQTEAAPRQSVGGSVRPVELAAKGSQVGAMQNSTAPQIENSAVFQEEGVNSPSPRPVPLELKMRPETQAPANAAVCKLSPDRCGTLRIEYKPPNEAGSPAATRARAPTSISELLVGKPLPICRDRNDDASFALPPDPWGTSQASLVASPEPPSPAYEGIDPRAGRDSVGSAAGQDRRYVVDFALPLKVAPYVDPYQTVRDDFRAAAGSRTWKACVLASAATTRMIAAQDRGEDLLRVPQAASDLQREASGCGSGNAFEGPSASWIPLPAEVERAIETYSARASSALTSFGKQIASLQDGPSTYGGMGRARSAESGHVLNAAKGTLLQIQSLYSRAAAREHGVFRAVCEEAATQAGILDANLSRVVGDLDVELAHALEVHGKKCAKARALASAKCPEKELYAIAARASDLADATAERLASAGKGLVAERVWAARSEMSGESKCDRSRSLSRLLRELREAVRGDAHASRTVADLVNEAKPLVRRAAASTVDADALVAELADETSKFAEELLSETHTRCKEIGKTSRAAFARKMDDFQRERDRCAALDREAWTSCSVALASYENRLSLDDRQSYFLLAHAKELLDQAVAASWAHDRLAMFSSWIALQQQI